MTCTAVPARVPSRPPRWPPASPAPASPTPAWPTAPPTTTPSPRSTPPPPRPTPPTPPPPPPPPPHPPPSPRPPPPPPPPPTPPGRGGPPGAPAGHPLVGSMLRSPPPTSGAITAKDTAGNTYLLARDTNDGSAGDRSVILVATGVKALAAGASITLTYPSSAETHVSVDEFSGVTGIDLAAGATGTGTAFNSGTTPTTSQPSEILIDSIGTESGTTPTWATGWPTLPPLAVSTDYLDTAYRFVTTTGTYA